MKKLWKSLQIQWENLLTLMQFSELQLYLCSYAAVMLVISWKQFSQMQPNKKEGLQYTWNCCLEKFHLFQILSWETFCCLNFYFFFPQNSTQFSINCGLFFSLFSTGKQNEIMQIVETTVLFYRKNNFNTTIRKSINSGINFWSETRW